MVSEAMLRSYFIKFGSLDDVVIMEDSATKRPRGFGFVTFEEEESVAKACETQYHTVDIYVSLCPVLSFPFFLFFQCVSC